MLRPRITPKWDASDVWSMRARKSPHRSNGNPYESTKANRPRLYVRTYVRPNSNFKRSQSRKTPKNRFSKNPIKRPGICRSRYKICKNLGTFIRTSQNWLFALFQPTTNIFKNLKFQKLKNLKMSKKHLFSSIFFLAFITPLWVSKLNFASDRGILNPHHIFQ